MGHCAYIVPTLCQHCIHNTHVFKWVALVVECFLQQNIKQYIRERSSIMTEYIYIHYTTTTHKHTHCSLLSCTTWEYCSQYKKFANIIMITLLYTCRFWVIMHIILCRINVWCVLSRASNLCFNWKHWWRYKYNIDMTIM